MENENLSALAKLGANLGLELVSGVVGGLIGYWLGHRRFVSEQWWQNRADVYRRALDSLITLEDSFKTLQASLESAKFIPQFAGWVTSFDEANQKFDEARHALARMIAQQQFYLSPPALVLLNLPQLESIPMMPARCQDRDDEFRQDIDRELQSVALDLDVLKFVRDRFILRARKDLGVASCWERLRLRWAAVQTLRWKVRLWWHSRPSDATEAIQ